MSQVHAGPGRRTDFLMRQRPKGKQIYELIPYPVRLPRFCGPNAGLNR